MKYLTDIQVSELLKGKWHALIEEVEEANEDIRGWFNYVSKTRY